MLEPRDEWIQKRAYAIWEEEGYPSGRDTVHWEQASNERIALEKSVSKDEKIDVKPKAKRKAVVAATPLVSDAAVKAETKRASKKDLNAKI
ncbi:DUF2934 domain-containing protein [Rhizobium calliandrae]|uniref:DUF2934 domain-containing protein n=1 Tax=Rhizobium calliandrae TaxID=1312182 RepID=A0ABT7KBL1_9HYPH|nr:DUF2934 domain-containing protein [Rhizobium calliandrae]MDL2405952.1 DUF2934 domain-containing protein [Rhizobium calliandrae]